MDMLLHQKCNLGDKCPNHHPKGFVCLAWNTVHGCNSQQCKFSHEVIGPTFAKALANHVHMKAQTRKEEKERLRAAGVITEEQAEPAGRKSKTASTLQHPKSKTRCRHWFNANSPGACRHGDECKFSHSE